MSVLPTLEAEYIITGKAKLELRPIAFLGRNSVLAVQAAECANEQGRFWQFHDVLYANQGEKGTDAFSARNLKRFAEALGLDSAAFTSCLDSGRYASMVVDKTDAASQRGVSKTPTIFVNGTEAMSGLEEMRATIERNLPAE